MVHSDQKNWIKVTDDKAGTTILVVTDRWWWETHGADIKSWAEKQEMSPGIHEYKTAPISGLPQVFLYSEEQLVYFSLRWTQ